jgi:hypothetical protein
VQFVVNLDPSGHVVNWLSLGEIMA